MKKTKKWLSMIVMTAVMTLATSATILATTNVTNQSTSVVQAATAGIISPSSVTFTKGVATDTSFTITLNGRTPLNMYVGTYKLIYGTDWSLAGNVVTIKKSLLATAPVGTSVIRLDVDAGVDPIFSVIVTPATLDATIAPATITFTKGSAVATSFSITLNGNRPVKLITGTYTLVAGTDYTVSGNVVTLTKAFLATAPIGTNVVTLDVSSGVDPTFSVIVTPATLDATIAPATITVTQGVAATKSFTMTLNGKTPLAVYAGTTLLTNGTQWTVVGNVVTLTAAYIATLPVGNTVIKLDVNTGVDPTLTLVVIPADIADSTDITSKFTDANFKTEVYKLIGKTSPAPILYSDVKGIAVVDVRSKNISSLSGIEYFTTLTSLNCAGNQLTGLDLSKNTALTILACTYNQLTVLDVTKNTALTSLYCTYNQLSTLDITKNTVLTSLYCYSNQITTLYSIKNTWGTEYYKIQYTDSTHTTTTSNLVITIKY